MRSSRAGWTSRAARAMAQRRFGSVAQVKDECRDSWGMRAIDALRTRRAFRASARWSNSPATPRSCC